MKRDFVENLLKDKVSEGTDLKPIIDSIMDENSKDIGKAKGDNEKLSEQVEHLTQEISDRDEQLAELKKVNADELKSKIEELEAKNKESATEYEAKVTELKRESAIKESLYENGVTSIEQVMRQLDLDAITFKDGSLIGLKEQIETLKADPVLKGWFSTSTNLEGAKPKDSNTTPPDGGKDLSEMGYDELVEYAKTHPDFDFS